MLSGRGRQGGRGRGFNRGRGRNHRTSHKPRWENYKKKKTLEDYYFYAGSAKQASDYAITKEKVVNHIRTTHNQGKDVAIALENYELPDTDGWKPTLKTSEITSTEPAEIAKRDAENKQFEIEFKSECESYQKRREIFNTNLTKAYGLIYGRCAKGMAQLTQAREDFESDIKENPIKLLKAIKKHAQNYQESRYDIAVMSDAFKTVF